MSLAIAFGANLRHHRKAKHLTQAQLAEQVDLSTEMISRIERGAAAPSFQTIERLSDVLDVPEVAFFGIGLVIAHNNARSRILSKIHTKLSRLSEDKLVRADKMLSALVD